MSSYLDTLYYIQKVKEAKETQRAQEQAQVNAAANAGVAKQEAEREQQKQFAQQAGQAGLPLEMGVPASLQDLAALGAQQAARAREEEERKFAQQKAIAEITQKALLDRLGIAQAGALERAQLGQEGAKERTEMSTQSAEKRANTMAAAALAGIQGRQQTAQQSQATQSAGLVVKRLTQLVQEHKAKYGPLAAFNPLPPEADDLKKQFQVLLAQAARDQNTNPQILQQQFLQGFTPDEQQLILQGPKPSPAAKTLPPQPARLPATGPAPAASPIGAQKAQDWGAIYDEMMRSQTAPGVR
jgi:hypothetical protein